MSNKIEDVNIFGSEEFRDKFLSFYLENQMFAIPVVNVIQIIGMQEIVSILEYPEYARGVIHLRGDIIPVIDMRLRLKRPEKQYTEKNCTIITRIHDEAIGLIVDGVDEVLEIAEDQISLPPKMEQEKTQNYVTGIARVRDHIILLLDTNEILFHKDFQTLMEGKKEATF